MNKTINYIRFPNGKAWQIDLNNNVISGTVQVGGFENEYRCSKDQLAAVFKAVTGGVDLFGFSYSYVGKNLVSFQGITEELPVDPEGWAEKGCEHLTLDSPVLRQALKDQYGLTDTQLDYAFAKFGTEYGEEDVYLNQSTGHEIRTPIEVDERNYARVVVDGLEIAYWSHNKSDKTFTPEHP